jgi:hypothetical protein
MHVHHQQIDKIANGKAQGLALKQGDCWLQMRVHSRNSQESMRSVSVMIK